MLGIDSANFGIIKSNLSVLPNFARALGAGVFRRLESPGDLCFLSLRSVESGDCTIAPKASRSTPTPRAAPKRRQCT
jgi:hypothetical protein